MQEITKRVAKTIKRIRKDRKWSLDKTALATGVSKAMLGQIERGESSPTLALLWKIANGFHISFSQLLENYPANKNENLVRTGKPQKISTKDDKIHIKSLFSYDQQLHCEIFIIKLLPGCEYLSAAHETGVTEHLIIAEGSMEVLLNGMWTKLRKGEGICFKADQAHGYRNLTSQNACFHNIIHYPYNT